MAGYRDRFIQASSQWVRFLPQGLLRMLTNQNLILPVYHLVSDECVPHVEHLYKIKSTKAFKHDLEYLLKYFHPIDYHTLTRHIHENKPFDHPSFFLTFDDGLQEFHTIVAPILEQYGVSAMNFLNSAFIDNKDLFYRYKTSLLIDRLRGSKKNDLKKIGDLLETTFSNIEDIYSLLLDIDYKSRKKLDLLASMLGLDFQEYLVSARPYLSSNQINDLTGKGFTFGAHSDDHPIYADISFDEQVRQTKISIDAVVDRFDLQYRAFAFPFTDFGVSKKLLGQFFSSPINLDLSFGSAGLKHDIYPYHLHRIPMEMGHLNAKQIIRSEMLYYFLKGVSGKNKIRRV